MNECPACGASIKEQDSFCKSCGAALKLPETDRFFCTECGTRVKASQEVCHSCQQPLTPEDLEHSPPTAAGRQVPVNAWRAPFWAIALIGGSALAVLLVAWWLFPWQTPPRPSAVPP